MKALFAILLILLTSDISGVVLHEMMKKLKNKSSYSATKTNTMSIIGTVLLNKGYEASFVAGVLGNINHEGNIGMFESSAYISHPEKEPQYLKYMDKLYSYRTK